jgi:hypothetical protein
MSDVNEPIEGASAGLPSGGPEGQPTEEELRAALEEEMSRVHVGDLVLQSVVSLVNLAARKTGTAPGLEPERDLEQVQIAIDAVRSLLPSVERVAPEQAAAVRDALSQLQIAFVTAGGEASQVDGGPEAQPVEPKQESRIWTPPGV